MGSDNKDKIMQIFIHSISKSFSSIFRYRKEYLVINIIATIILGSIPALLILIMQRIINMLQLGGGSFNNILIYILIYIAVNVITNLFREILNYYNSKFAYEFSKHIELSILHKAEKLKLSDFENPETYNMINRAQSQNGTSVIAYVSEVMGLIKEIVTVLSTVLILVKFRWWIIVIVMIVPIFRCILTILTDKKWYDIRFERTQTERKAWYINFLMLSGNAFKEIKVLDISKYLISRYNSIKDYVINQDKAVLKKITLFTVVLDGAEWMLTGGIFTYTVYGGFVGSLLIGDVIAYTDSMYNIKNSMESIFSSIENLTEQSLYINLLYEYLDIEIGYIEKKDGNTDTNQIKIISKIEFRNVSFRYKDGAYALKNINMLIERNSRIGIIGENGSGKSTLIKLILGLYDRYEGEIFINDMNMRTIDMHQYNRLIGCVFQDYIKYEATVRENIAFGDLSKIHNDAEICKAVKAVKMKNRIEEDGGIDETIGNWFGKIQYSTGEWQRIAIARALIKSACMYIFDEADASVDVMKQNNFAEVYKAIADKKICIYISHRINGIKQFADKIYVMESGEIKEDGTHEELMKRKGKYYKMYCQDSQSKFMGGRNQGV